MKGYPYESLAVNINQQKSQEILVRDMKTVWDLERTQGSISYLTTLLRWRKCYNGPYYNKFNKPYHSDSFSCTRCMDAYRIIHIGRDSWYRCIWTTTFSWKETENENSGYKQLPSSQRGLQLIASYNPNLNVWPIGWAWDTSLINPT